MLQACAGSQGKSQLLLMGSEREKGKMMGKGAGFPSVAGGYCCSTLPLISFIPAAFSSSEVRV